MLAWMGTERSVALEEENREERGQPGAWGGQEGRTLT